MSTLYLIQIRFSKSFQVQLQAAAVFRIWGTTLLQHTALTQPNHNHILKRNSINATWHISSQVRFQLQLVDCLLYAACQFFRSSFVAKIPQQLASAIFSNTSLGYRSSLSFSFVPSEIACFCAYSRPACLSFPQVLP